MLTIKASDLKFKYPRDTARRNEPKFSGLPDPATFNRNDLYEVLPMMAAAMDELGSVDGEVLHLLEDILNTMPGFIVSREEVFNYLTGCAREVLY
ncbi:hypothetical protein [Trichlorobacter ammonificans]|uniref:Uncharacterized protein n=1 Tax=Trichlorobacter ammonificans TaxID=2916410 RepID=A0ABM9D3Q0_9BACT|nr:hypothetical protein [Trichlorobacter ammonificans]CAH2029871.1 conserved protein of unknown function [Trichlorobacter ammonificans]